MDHKLMALVIFLAAYLLFILSLKQRAIIAVLAAGLLILTGTISGPQAFLAINWNVMGIFVGMLVVADFFMESRVPAYLAEIIVNRAPNTAWAILFICGMTGFLSAFLENVATLLVVAPIALSLANKLNFNPIQMMIGIAISSNLQGTATLIGDPPSMLLGGFAKMNFNDFFFYQGKPSIFFAVQIGALASFLVLYFFYRKQPEKISLIRAEKVKSWGPTILLTGLIVLLAASSFVDTNFSYSAGLLSMLFAIIIIIWDKLINRKPIISNLRSLDWDTTFFLMGIFVLVGSLTLTGWLDTLSLYLAGLIGTNILFGFILLIFISCFLSAFIDNVPYLATMLPVAVSLSNNLAINPSLFLFGLLLGSCLGGNITPIGASANVVACGLLKQKGYEVKFLEFVKIGLPFTLAAVTASSLFIWFIWGIKY